MSNTQTESSVPFFKVLRAQGVASLDQLTAAPLSVAFKNAEGVFKSHTFEEVRAKGAAAANRFSAALQA